MNEQVVDISETLKYLASELNSMRQTINSQHAEICRLNRKVEAQSKEIRTLKKENSSLHKRLSKYEQPPKDSNNSSIPPSKENVKSEVIRRTNSLREKSDKPVGGQLGHQGHTRKMVDVPDEVIEHSFYYNQNCAEIYLLIHPLKWMLHTGFNNWMTC